MMKWLKLYAGAIKNRNTILFYLTLKINLGVCLTCCIIKCRPDPEIVQRKRKYREKPVRGNVIDAVILKCFDSRYFLFDSQASKQNEKKALDTTKNNFETVYLT